MLGQLFLLVADLYFFMFAEGAVSNDSIVGDEEFVDVGSGEAKEHDDGLLGRGTTLLGLLSSVSLQAHRWLSLKQLTEASSSSEKEEESEETKTARELVHARKCTDYIEK